MKRLFVLVLVALNVSVGAGASAASDLEIFQPPEVHRWYSSPEHDADRFSLALPWLWSKQPVYGAVILEARGQARLPIVRVMNLDEPLWLPLNFATRAAASQLKSLGSEVVVISESVTKLPGGERANTGEVYWRMDIGVGLRLRSLVVSVFHGGRWVLVIITTTRPDQPGEFPRDLKNIAFSLSFGDR